jgi:uncharacterized protein (TIGR02246 family)
VTADEQAIRSVIDRWHAATAAADVDAVLSLMAEDATFFVPGRPPMQGRSTFEMGLRHVLGTHRIESTADVQELAVAGDLAYCVTLLTVRMIPRAGGDANVRSGLTLSIFRKPPDGAWVLSRDANLLPPG